MTQCTQARAYTRLLEPAATARATRSTEMLAPPVACGVSPGDGVVQVWPAPVDLRITPAVLETAQYTVSPFGGSRPSISHTASDSTLETCQVVPPSVLRHMPGLPPPPPGEPTSRMSGLLGCTQIAEIRGASWVAVAMRVQVSPPSSDRYTPLPGSSS